MVEKAYGNLLLRLLNISFKKSWIKVPYMGEVIMHLPETIIKQKFQCQV